MRIHGSLHIEALQKTCEAIVARHEILRTTFIMHDGIPVQCIGESRPVAIDMTDLRAWPTAEREGELQRLLTKEAQRPFHLASDLMLRASLIRVGEAEHVLLLTMHPIASDDGSFDLLFHELAALYPSFTTKHSLALPALPMQYADYAVWQQRWLHSEMLHTQLTYWKHQLDGAPATLSLPTDYPRQAVRSYRGARRNFVLSPSLSAALKTLSQREGVTLFMTLLAAFQTLLHRYTYEDDIIVGSPVAGRQRVETQALIGCFVNMLVLRTSFSGNPTFRELLHRVQEVTLGAYAHPDLPCEKLVEELRLERTLSHAPLFQVLFAFHDLPPALPELSGLTLTPVEVERGASHFDVALYMWEDAERLKGAVEYSTDLFDAATMVRMLEHFQVLLAGLVAHPEQPLADFPLLTAAERHQVLVEWNTTPTAYPGDLCLHQLFERQVQDTPDAVAVVDAERQMTYRDLNACANQLAHYLRVRGVGPAVLVGICVERSLEMVMALLGVLKAGGAYVPLDPAYPQARLGFILQDTRMPLVVTQAHLIEQLSGHAARLVCMDTEEQRIVQESAANLNSGVTADNLAYVLYTSGSTGWPKGVQIPHRAVVNFMHTMRQQPGLTDHDTLLAVTSLGFDIAALELFLPLTVGGRVVIASRETAADGAQLLALLSRSSATVMQATPVTWQLLCNAGWQGSPGLTILCGGEALPRQLATQLLARGAAVWNLYGPTETTIWSTVCQVTPGEGPVCIGRPIANTQVYILDAHQQLVPIGVPGELHIGGLGLANGYLNRPELTAEKFIPHPFSSEPGARLYKTGDLVRYRPDGSLEFLGRLDHQVKIRGFRIELGEIEAVLCQHAAVRQAVVLAREDVPGNKRLVAYVIPHPESACTSSTLQKFLKERLPVHMVPAAFVLLDSMPLTPNGKIDRRALPAPDQISLDLTQSFVAPRTPVEEELARLWVRVLGVDRMGVHDNFFACGGDSLLAAQLCAHIEKAFGRHLPLATLFKAPTIAELATLLYQPEVPTASLLLPYSTAGSKPPFFSVHFGNSQMLEHFVDKDQPWYGLYMASLEGRRDPDALEVMATDYIRHMQTVQPEGPYFLGGFCFGGLLAFEIAQQLHKQGQTVALLLLLAPVIPDQEPQGRSPGLPRALYWVRYRLRKRFMEHVKTQIGELYLGCGRPMPHFCRKGYREVIMRRATRGYRPHVYLGPITVLRTNENPAQVEAAWRALAGGGLEVYEIPGQYASGSLFSASHAPTLVQQLLTCLQKAHVRQRIGSR